MIATSGPLGDCIISCRDRAYQVLSGFLSRGLEWLRLRSPLLQLSGSKDFEEMYSIGEKIGEGSFGKVYVCDDLSYFFAPRGNLCVKVVPLNGRHPHRMAKFSEEERREWTSSLLNLSDPGIVRFHRFAIFDDAFHIVMERCCGATLPDYLGLVDDGHGDESYALPSLEVQCLARQILSAIKALHSAQIMHRDVKLENFRFANETSKTLKLLDFGFCKATSGKPAIHSVTGTLLYCAPEVFDGTYCQSCDMWSLGIVLFHLLSGQLPFQTSDVMILRSMHRDPVLMGDSLFRGKVWQKVSIEGHELVRGLLTVDPAKRHSADAASRHPWLRPMSEKESNAPSLIERCSRSFENLLSATDMKRSMNMGNLAEAAGDSSDDEPLSKSASMMSFLAAAKSFEGQGGRR